MESLAQAKMNGDPIGTLDELAELGIEGNDMPSCSRRTGPQAGANKGCPFFRSCRFKPWRDGMNGLKGPLNIGVEIILSRSDGGAQAQRESTCYAYYTGNLKNRAKASEETGETVRIIAYEGDGKEIKEWHTKSLPPSTEHPNGHVVPYMTKHVVTPFKRPKDRFPIEVQRQGAREEMMDEQERAALKQALAASNVAETDVSDALAGTRDEEPEFVGPVGKPRKVKG